jgi:hypothetical protein
MRTTCVTLALAWVLAGTVAGCGSGSDDQAGGDAALTVELAEQNGSGQAGTATFTLRDGGGTRILLELTNPPLKPQPAHVHDGSCDDLGDPVVALANVVGGRSETDTDLSLDELEGDGLVIHAHKSESEYDVSVACAPVEREAESIGY